MAELRKTSNRQLTEAHHRLQKQVSQALNEMARAVVGDEPAPDTPAGSRPAEEGGSERISPPILTHYGVREARYRRAWTLAGLILLGLIGLLWWRCSRPDPIRECLQRFCADPPRLDADWKPPTLDPALTLPQSTSPKAGMPRPLSQGLPRLRAYQKRAWLANPGMPVIVNLDSALVGAIKRLPFQPAADFIDRRIRPAQWIPEANAWLAKEQVSTARELISIHAKGGKTPTEVLRRANPPIPFLTLEDLVAEMRSAGVDEILADLVKTCLRGQTDFEGHNWIRDRLLAGQYPQTLELIALKGWNGIQKYLGQQRLDTRNKVSYEGRLLRFVGWTGLSPEYAGQTAADRKDLADWRVLDLKLTGD